MAKRKIRNPQFLEEYLHNLTVDRLKGLAHNIPIQVPTRKDDIVRLIHSQLMDPTRLQQIWKELGSLQQSAVAEVVHGPSDTFDASAFRAKYNGDPDWGGSGYGYRSTQPSALNLFFYQKVMPKDLRAALKEFVPAPRDFELQTATTLPESVPLTQWHWQRDQGEPEEVELIDRHTQQMAQNDLLTTLRLIEAGKIRITAKTKRPTAASVRTLGQVLDGGDYFPPPDPDATDDIWGPTEPGAMRAFAWPLLVQAGKLAELAGTKLQLTPAGKKALSSPAHKTIGKIWKSWLRTTLLDEFNRISEIKGQTGRGKHGMTAPAGRRKTIAEALSKLPANQWISFSEFSRYMQASGYSFSVSRDLWELYIEDSNYGSLGYDGYGTWQVIQARYLLVFLMEYAATLGLIDIAYIPPAHARLDFGDLWGIDDMDCLSEYDGLSYIRLNNLGAWCLGQTSTYTPPQIEAQQLIKVLPNHDVVAIERLPASDRLQIERFARQSSDQVWKIERKKMLEAHEAGLTIREIQTFLEAKSAGDLPQTVAILFKEAAKKAAALTHMEDAHLLHVSDNRLARLIANESTVRKHCLPAGEQHIVVPAKSFSAFRRAVHDLGYSLPPLI